LAFECRYSVNITASNGAGEGPKQILIIEKNQKTPSEPTFDEVTVTSTTVTLRWSPPKNPFGAIRYNLTRKIDETILGSVNTTSLGPGTLEAVVRNYTFTDLLPYTMYTFLLRVKNHARQSRGVEQTVTTKQAVPSAAPANLMAISRPGHPTDLAVNWSSVPTNQSNGIITSYTLYWWLMFHPNKGCQYETGTNVTKLKQNITDGRQSYLIKALKSNSTYCVAITASTSAGEGPCTTAFGRTVKGFINVENLSIVDTSADSVFIEWQLSVTANLQEVVSVNIMVDEPSAPQNLFVADLGNGWVNLSWESPASPNGYISSYRVVYYSDTKREEVTTSFTFQDLHLTCSKFSATKYVFEVYAVNTAEELEGPAVTKRTKVCTKHKVLSLVIAMVIVPCCIITACGLLVWWCIFYPKQKLDIKIVKAISHPKMFASTGRRPEKEVFDTLKAKPKVLESETYMIMKPAMHHNRKFSKDNNSSQEYLKMSMTYISDAT
ncbi:putative phosphatidylinositol phosphatase PTPRQ, partial [Apostichopus japonicus]